MAEDLVVCPDCKKKVYLWYILNNGLCPNCGVPIEIVRATPHSGVQNREQK